MFRSFLVRGHQKGFLLRQGDFVGILEPGRYWHWDPLVRLRVDLFDLTVPEFQHPLLPFLKSRHPELVEKHFRVCRTTATQAAVVHKDGRFVGIVPPSSERYFWKDSVPVTFEIHEISGVPRVSTELAQPWIRAAAENGYASVRDAMIIWEIPENHVGMATCDGHRLAPLPPGVHVFWRYNNNLNVAVVDQRLQEVELNGQEILTKDKVTLRINLAATYVVTDPTRLFELVAKPAEFLHRELQFGLRAAIGTRTLDELLEDKSAVDEMVRTHAENATRDVGIRMSSVGVKDLILPGEMRAILGQVVEAEKAAQANIIRRREETSATRSLLNTAKVMENNPVALRLKEFEVLERLTEKIGNVSVYGGFDGLLRELLPKARSE